MTIIAQHIGVDLTVLCYSLSTFPVKLISHTIYDNFAHNQPSFLFKSFVVGLIVFVIFL